MSIPSSGGDGSADTALAGLAVDLDSVERLHQHVEPTLRDLNRTLSDLVGPHPSAADGAWFALETDGSLVARLGVDQASRLVGALTTALALSEAPPSLGAIRRSPRPAVIGLGGTGNTEGCGSVHLGVNTPGVNQ